MHVRFVKRVLSHRSGTWRLGREPVSGTQCFHIQRKKDLARNVEGWGRCTCAKASLLASCWKIGFCGLGINW